MPLQKENTPNGVLACCNIGFMDKNITINRKVIPGLDVLKFSMALLIVAIHSEAVNNIPIIYEALNPIIMSAVPMFFVVSSFLLFRKMRQDQLTFKQERGILLHFTWRLFLLYIFWMVVQFPLVIHTRQYLNMDFLELIYNFLFDIAFRSTFHGAWFFSALIVGTWLIYFSSKILKDKTIWILPLFIALYTYHADELPSYYQVVWLWYHEHVINPQNSFFVALFWISIGFILAKPTTIKKIEELRSNYIMGGFCVAWILSIVLIDLRIFMVLSLFVFFYNWRLENKPIYKMMRQSSILIFTLHFIFIGIFRVLFPNIDLLQHGLILYLVLIILCLLSSLTILKLKNYKAFSWLKYSF